MIDSSVERQPVPFPYPIAMAQMLDIVRQYMSPSEIDLVIKACHLALETCQEVGRGTRSLPPLDHALAVTTIMAQLMHVDAIGISAGLVFEAVDAELLLVEQVEQVLGIPTARVVGSMARLNILNAKNKMWPPAQ